MYAIIRLRGKVGVRKDIEYTLKLLRLNRKMHCILVPENDVSSGCIKGMLKKIKDYVTWGKISDDILKAIILKRGRKQGNRRLSKEEADIAFKDIKEGRKMQIKPVFRLTPPSGGFKKSIKYHWPKGELGYRKEKINDLLKKMV